MEHVTPMLGETKKLRCEWSSPTCHNAIFYLARLVFSIGYFFSLVNGFGDSRLSSFLSWAGMAEGEGEGVETR